VKDPVGSPGGGGFARRVSLEELELGLETKIKDRSRRLTAEQRGRLKAFLTGDRDRLRERYDVGSPVSDVGGLFPEDPQDKRQREEEERAFEMLLDEKPLTDLIAKDCLHNPFRVRSDKIALDLLTDSGTSRLTMEQEGLLREWAEELIPSVQTFSYARPTPRVLLDHAVGEIFGRDFSFHLTVQGRSSEYLLLKALTGACPDDRGKPLLGDHGSPGRRLVLCNRPFDTTKGNMQAVGLEVKTLTEQTTVKRYEEAETIFLGDMPLDRVSETADWERTVDAFLITVTDNGGGGQPVSWGNFMAVADFALEHGKLFWVDACRVFENALFIHLFEKEEMSPLEIVREMLKRADLVTISFKKMYSHSGGAILINKGSKLIGEEVRESLDRRIKRDLTEIYGNGYDSYAGRTGRDMIEIISGLLEAIDPVRIARRIAQTCEVGRELRADYGFPVVPGAHALYAAADRVLTGLGGEPTKCAAELLNSVCMAAARVRGCGLGYIVYGGEMVGGKYGEGGDIKIDSLRWAFPRMQYSTGYYKRMLRGIARAYKDGVFGGLTAGLAARNYKADGFYHFEGEYDFRPDGEAEYRRVVEDLHGYCGA